MSLAPRPDALLALSVGALLVLLVGCATGPGGEVRLNRQAERTTLAACPSRPSCVVSRDDAGGHAVEALSFDGPAVDAMARLRGILEAMPRTNILTANAHYLHATQESGLMHFTDDVEFLIDPDTGRIDVRSCSRAGYYDFGVNRARVETIRSRLNSPG